MHFCRYVGFGLALKVQISHRFLVCLLCPEMITVHQENRNQPIGTNRNFCSDAMEEPIFFPKESFIKQFLKEPFFISAIKDIFIVYKTFIYKKESLLCHGNISLMSLMFFRESSSLTRNHIQTFIQEYTDIISFCSLFKPGRWISWA